MEEIKLKEINLSALKKLENQGTKSIIYTDGDMCYKFLYGFYSDEKRDLYKKFLAMDGIKIDNVLLPCDLIIEDGELKGYTMKYFKNSIPLSYKFFRRYFNCNELIVYVDKASKILRNIHNNDIICQDLSFENILIDNNENIMFCDIDGCTYTYKEHYSPFYSKLFKEFLVESRKFIVSTREDIDKVSMILSFYITIYGESLSNITAKKYRTLSKNIRTLENLRGVYNMLVGKGFLIRDIPYLDEVVDLTDNYEIDRKKLLTMKQKLLRKY